MRRFSVPLFLLLVCASLHAQAPRQADYTTLAKQADLVVADFQFHSGEKLQQLRLHYVTWGTPKRNAGGDITNAVLLLHGTLGKGIGWGNPVPGSDVHPLLGPGAPFDVGEYFVIAPDTIGTGQSSKPSDGLRMKFPHYNLEDIVKAERLVVEHLGVKHLRAILGASMGGRQTWQWAIQYPGFADGLVPMIASPFPNAGERGVIDFLPVAIIESDPAWQNGNYKKNPDSARLADILYGLFLSTPTRLLEQLPTRADAANYVRSGKGGFNFPDANDLIYMMNLNDGYDAWAHIDRVTCPVLMINMVDDRMVPVQLGQAKLVTDRMKNATYIEVTEQRSYGHRASGRTTAVWGPTLKQWLQQLPHSAN